MHRRAKSSNHGGPTPNKVANERKRSASLIKQFDASRPARPSPLAASAVRDIPVDLLERIRAFPLFSAAPESFFTDLGAYMRPQVFSPQESILTEGAEGKAMYFLIRGAVVVTSKDQESVYGELQPGSCFGEISLLMDIPRTANVVARFKSLVVRLNKEDLSTVLSRYPNVAQTLREEAAERLAIFQRAKDKKREINDGQLSPRPGKRVREILDPMSPEDSQDSSDGEETTFSKRRKAPSPALVDTTKSSALGSGSMQVRPLLKKLPLFTDLPSDVLHFLGMNAQLRNYPPFTNIITEGSHGREIFFITSGEVEVLAGGAQGPKSETIKARLGTNDYFGEVVSLSLSPRRTATVRSVVAVECLTISGEILDELWRRCPPRVREQIEYTAKQRLKSDPDADMLESGESTLAFSGLALEDDNRNAFVAKLPTLNSRIWQTGPQQHVPGHEPTDSDPFRTSEWSLHRRQRSRRSSTDNMPNEPSPLTDPEALKASRRKSSIQISSQPPSRPSSPVRPRRPRTFHRQPSSMGKGLLPDDILIKVLSLLNVGKLMQCRRVSLHWSRLLSTSPELFKHLDLNLYSRTVTDEVLINSICPFVGQRPETIIISDCHHITDDGFSALVSQCSANARVWQMRSVWDISAHVILELAEKAQSLESVDFSNVRKVSDNLLGLLLGAERSRPSPSPSVSMDEAEDEPRRGCPDLVHLRLSYCKGITNRFMHMAAIFAASRLETLDLTRCTAISDGGFHFWAQTSFPRLRKLILADCTYLSDAAIQSLVQAAPDLRELDLSFCCALSDASLDIIASSLPKLSALDVAFCGSAVSDSSLRRLAAELKQLEALGVRGCVRVTGAGVESVLFGCSKLRALDVSQCLNVRPWLASYRAKRFLPPGVALCTLADGRWRNIHAK